MSAKNIEWSNNEKLRPIYRMQIFKYRKFEKQKNILKRTEKRFLI
jgi:hypothetical protein